MRSLMSITITKFHRNQTVTIRASRKLVIQPHRKKDYVKFMLNISIIKEIHEGNISKQDFDLELLFNGVDLGFVDKGYP